jgi:peptide/nickel transport system substrate-binding protein
VRIRPAVVSLVAILLAGCEANPSLTAPPDATRPPAPAPSPAPSLDDWTEGYQPELGREGGEVTIGDWQEVRQLNPYYLNRSSEVAVAAATWASLIVQTAEYRYQPDLAVDIPTTANGGVTVPGVRTDAMTVTWTLKPNLRWSDGEALTCDDFLYTWEWILDPDNVGMTTTGWDQITDFECADDVTIVLHFARVYEGYLTLIKAPLPRHYLESIPMVDQVQGAGFRPDDIAKLPVSGAFRYDSWRPGTDITLVRNPAYKSFATGLAAHLDRLVFRWYEDSDAMIAGFAAGEVDFATDLQDSDIPKLDALGLHDQTSAIPAMRLELLRPNWSEGPFFAGGGISGCSRNPVLGGRGTGCPMADPAMRRAVALAVDKEAIASQLLGGSVVVAQSGIPPDAWFYTESFPTPNDPDGARRLLDEAGWVDSDGDGVREKKDLRAQIELCTTGPQARIDTANQIAAWLGEIGIQAIVNVVAPGDMFADWNTARNDTPCVLSRSNFDLAELEVALSIDPIYAYFSYHSSQFEPDGANDAQVVDADIDAALDIVKTSVDFVAIKHAMADFQRLYVEKTVEVPLYYPRNVELVGSGLGNYYANPIFAPTWNVVDWFSRE